MKRNAIRRLVVMMIAAMVFALTPVPVSAATKAPGKVKIKSVKVAAVSYSTNETTVTIKWKKAKRATGYIIYAKHGSGVWTKQKKVGRLCTKFKLTKVPAGQLDIRIQAVNKKKKGKFSAVKSRFIASPYTSIAYYDYRVKSKNKFPFITFARKKFTNSSPSLQGNTLILEYDLAANYKQYTDTELNYIATNYKTELKKDFAPLKSGAQEFKNKARLDAGISGVKVVAKYVFNGETVTSEAL